MTYVSIVNQILVVLAIGGQAASAVLFILLLSRTKNSFSGWIGRYGMYIAFFAVLIATSGSLFYSEIAGYEPCKLCWYQRILMYPQVLVLGLALWRKDKNAALYSLALSSMGVLVSGYHYLLQIGVAPALPCAAVGYSASCSQRFVMQFGYITIPMMALTVFVLTALLMLTVIKTNNSTYGQQ